MDAGFGGADALDQPHPFQHLDRVTLLLQAREEAAHREAGQAMKGMIEFALMCLLLIGGAWLMGGHVAAGCVAFLLGALVLVRRFNRAGGGVANG